MSSDLSLHDLLEIVHRTDPALWRIVDFLGETGMTMDDLVLLKVRGVPNFDDGFLHLGPTLFGSGTIALTKHAQQLIAAGVVDTFLSPERLRHQWAQIVRRYAWPHSFDYTMELLYVARDTARQFPVRGANGHR